MRKESDPAPRRSGGRRSGFGNSPAGRSPRQKRGRVRPAFCRAGRKLSRTHSVIPRTEERPGIHYIDFEMLSSGATRENPGQTMPALDVAPNRCPQPRARSGHGKVGGVGSVGHGEFEERSPGPDPRRKKLGGDLPSRSRHAFSRKRQGISGGLQDLRFPSCQVEPFASGISRFLDRVVPPSLWRPYVRLATQSEKSASAMAPLARPLSVPR